MLNIPQPDAPKPNITTVSNEMFEMFNQTNLSMTPAPGVHASYLAAEPVKRLNASRGGHRDYWLRLIVTSRELGPFAAPSGRRSSAAGGAGAASTGRLAFVSVEGCGP